MSATAPERSGAAPGAAPDRVAPPLAPRASAGPDVPAAARTPAAVPDDGRDGPLVAVCGLAGGAGTTLLAWLVARDALVRADGPVLLAELPAAGGGLAALTSVQGGRSLARLASEPAAARRWPPAPDGPDGLRLAAATAEVPPDVGEAQLARALADASREHALVVVDCGRLQTAEARAALGVASHVVWTVPAGPAAGETARTLLLETDLAPPPGGPPELLAVVATRPGAIEPRGHRALRQVVAERGERLVFVPHVRGLGGARARRGTPRRLSSAVAAIAGLLQREPPR